MKLLRCGMVALTLILATPALAQNQPTSSDMQIFAEKVKADKKALVAANLQLTESEANRFWPIYDSYQQDLQSINDRLASTIIEYANAYNAGSVDNATAKKLLHQVLDIESSEAQLQQTFVPKLERALPEVKVARYIQIENKIRAVVHYDLAAKIPLVE